MPEPSALRAKLALAALAPKAIANILGTRAHRGNAFPCMLHGWGSLREKLAGVALHHAYGKISGVECISL